MLLPMANTNILIRPM